MIFSGVLIFLLILGSAFFSGSETALTTISRPRIHSLVMMGNRRAQKIAWLRQHKEHLIGTVLLGNTLVLTAATAVGTSTAIQYFGNEAIFFSTAILSVLLFIFGEVLPKTYALQNSERCALVVAPMMVVLVRVLTPMNFSIQWVIHAVSRLFKLDISDGKSLLSAAEVIRGTIELHHSTGEMRKQDRDMLGSILDLNDVEVGSVMVHRKQVETIDIDLPAREIINLVIYSTHSRIPFWRENPDNIIGLLHSKDLMKLISAYGIEQITHNMIISILSEPWFVPETTNLRQQLLGFRSRRRHFAHVVNEYGSFLGIITLEDILEEIVGDIDDEHDFIRSADILPVGEQGWLVGGMVAIRDLNRHQDWHLPDDNATTIAGLLIHEARSIPEVGAIFSFHEFHFEVLEKKSNQILKIRMQRQEDAPIPTH